MVALNDNFGAEVRSEKLEVRIFGALASAATRHFVPSCRGGENRFLFVGRSSLIVEYSVEAYDTDAYGGTRNGENTKR